MKPLIYLSLVTCLIGMAVNAASAQTNSSATNLSDADKLKVLQKMREEWLENQKTNPPIYAVVFIDKEDGNPAIKCEIGVLGHTNVTAYKPLRSQAYEARLFDMNGKEISKTADGKKNFGLPLKPDKALLDGSFDSTGEAMWGNPRTLNFTNWDGASHYWEFNIVKSFYIKEPGNYRLQVQVCLFTKDTSGVFQPFILPPVETKVNISESDLGK
jgi:hypothetical protein